jgi:hypothetical protein
MSRDLSAMKIPGKGRLVKGWKLLEILLLWLRTNWRNKRKGNMTHKQLRVIKGKSKETI